MSYTIHWGIVLSLYILCLCFKVTLQDQLVFIQKFDPILNITYLGNHTVQIPAYTDLAWDYNFLLCYDIIARLFVIGVLPFIIWIFLNIKIVGIVKTLQERFGKYTTKTHSSAQNPDHERRLKVIAIVYSIFLLLFAFKKLCVLYFLVTLGIEAFKTDDFLPKWIHVMTIFQGFCLNILFGFNFAAIASTNQMFRNILKSYFVPFQRHF